MTEKSYSVVRVDEWSLRKMFNEGRYWERAQSHELVTRVGHNKHPAPPESGQPHCTRSQEVTYYDPITNTELARVHQYLRPDNSLGGSGMPDPKTLLHNGVLYHLHKKPKPNQHTSIPPSPIKKLARRIGRKLSHIWRKSRRHLRQIVGFETPRR